MTTTPHHIIDKNGKHTTVHRRVDGASSNKKAIPTAPTTPIKHQDYRQNGVLTGREMLMLGGTAELGRYLRDNFGWQPVIRATDSNFGVIEGAPDYNSLWDKMAVMTPEGAIIDGYGVYTKEQYMKAATHKTERLCEVGEDIFDEITEDIDQPGTSAGMIAVVASKIHMSVYGTNSIDWHRELDDADVVNVNGKDFYVGIEGWNSLACQKCGTFLHESVLSIDIEWGDANTCQQCGDEFSLATLTCAIRPGSVDLLDDDYAREVSWYHASVNPNWGEEIAKAVDNPVVHLGEKDTALDRASHVNSSGLSKMYLYEVKIKPEAPLSASLHPDDNVNQPKNADQMSKKDGMTGNGVNRYLNEYETQGAISLMAHNQSFEVIGMTAI